MKTLYFATISSVQIYSPTELEYLTAAFCNHTATDQADTQASQSHHFGVYFSPPIVKFLRHNEFCNLKSMIQVNVEVCHT